MSTVACGSGAPSVSQNCWPTRWISLCLHWEHILGETKKKYFSHFGVLMLQTRPGGWGGSSDHQNKTAPEPPLPYFGGSTSKKTAPEPPLPILLFGMDL